MNPEKTPLQVLLNWHAEHVHTREQARQIVDLQHLILALEACYLTASYQSTI